ncbi:TetR family transcriptional regulator [Paenibacillus pasadenensis]|uniref:Transcriptional regulator, TetR family n=1 Tax=Paenibacillus pasadenensis TaxID=217090 RepID=A0A2N5NAQ1_9BACL|nr:TetR family transcriptional regulator [Paenibacillus pasadenensis]PLT47436.1 Transcriptional regulator, TetR family [Paenibacillus pasadenensis]
MKGRDAEEKQTFIADARRAQIFEATIRTLDEIGYIRASMAQIAKRAGISAALISYHYRDKNDLMDYALMKLATDLSSSVLERTAAASGPREKLQAYIEASIAYQAENPARSTALIEIVFHARTADGMPYYKLQDDEDDPLENELRRILRLGQEQGEFGAFDLDAMASAIRGALDEYGFNVKLKARIDPIRFSQELVDLFSRAIGHR